MKVFPSITKVLGASYFLDIFVLILTLSIAFLFDLIFRQRNLDF